jgi:hypothetical protein
MVMLAPSMNGSPVIAFRMNTIRIDYGPIANKSIVGRKIEPAKCAVRMDMRMSTFPTSLPIDLVHDFDLSFQEEIVEHFTLSKEKPFEDFKKLVHTSNLQNAVSVRILSRFNQNIAQISDVSFDAYKKYDSESDQMIETDSRSTKLTRCLAARAF